MYYLRLVEKIYQAQGITWLSFKVTLDWAIYKMGGKKVLVSTKVSKINENQESKLKI